ncbi:MAG: hypothetical protein ABI539_08300 [Acidobacteriota bacterium]
MNDEKPTDAGDEDGRQSEIAEPDILSESGTEAELPRIETEELRSAIAEIAETLGSLRSELVERTRQAQTPDPIDAGAGRSMPRRYLTADALKQMKPDEIAKLDWNEVRQILNTGR